MKKRSKGKIRIDLLWRKNENDVAGTRKSAGLVDGKVTS